MTGGKHGDGFISLLAKVVRQAGIPDADIHASTKTLPGYFRPTKDWDLIVKVQGDLVAVIEVKAQVGSFGNNCNNRFEEGIGNAVDFWAAFREGTYRPSARPWLGYLVLLEDAPKSTQAGKGKASRHYQLRSEFKGASYRDRYKTYCERLVRERLYDATCFLMSDAVAGRNGDYSEPSAELNFRRFATSLAARSAAYAAHRAR